MVNFTSKQLKTIVCLGLAAVTFALYLPTIRHDFINIDDTRMVSKNPFVQSGMTWNDVVWSFKSMVSENWHPLTWLSYMLDVEIFGTGPAGHLLVNDLLHTANVVLLFALLNRLTGALWRSAMVAALFAWHPLHVESVAWIGERKDVLSAFFCLLTLLAYARFTRSAEHPGSHPSPAIFYLLSLFFFTCGLMSKPMIVTLPFLMLLLDFWPLKRVQASRVAIQSLLIEKIPFFVLAAIMCWVTVVAQKTGGAMMLLADAPVGVRFENALFAYVGYISKMFWPVNLAFFYPYRYSPDPLQTIACAVSLLLCTVLFFIRARRQPFLLVGWLWFLGTLVPVIGLVQVGGQSMADRYSYIPGIGLSITIVWAIAEMFGRTSGRRYTLPVLSAVALAGCITVTSLQIRYWRNSITLAQHALQVTQDNFVAYETIGRALADDGKLDQALPYLLEATRTGPRDLTAHINAARVLQAKNRINESISFWEDAVRLGPQYLDIHCDLGLALMQAGRTDEAVDQLTQVIRANPDFAMAHHYLATTFAQQNKLPEAVHEYREALRTQPDYPEALDGLAWILAAGSDRQSRSPAEAVRLASRACELTAFKQPVYLTTLAAAYAQAEKFDRAAVTAEKARVLALAAGQKETVDTDDKLLKLIADRKSF